MSLRKHIYSKQQGLHWRNNVAIIRYKCDTCKREIEIPENRRGLEVINRCVITDKCRGELYKIDRKQDFIRGEFPPKVPGLTDYTQRRVLYNHTQAVAATEWFIEHNLGVAPSVQVVIDRAITTEETQEDIPCALRSDTETFQQVEITDFDVTITGPNTLTITFTDPESGVAQMIARSTAPTAVEASTTTETPTFQVTSTNTLLTIATLNSTITSNQPIGVDIVFTPPGESSLAPISYVAPASVSSDSPWNDFPTILIQGKQYRVRSFNAFNSGMTDGTIPDGSSFYINQISDGSPKRDITSREVILLLAQSPYDNIDKITNQLIDANRITAANAELSLFYQDRELFAFTTIISSTFPPIREV